MSFTYRHYFNYSPIKSNLNYNIEFKYLDYDNLPLETQALAKEYIWIFHLRIVVSSDGCNSNFLQVQLAELFFADLKFNLRRKNLRD